MGRVMNHTFGVIYEANFGGVYAKVTLDEFKQLGYDFGDSFDLVFSSGYCLYDIPYYNGYYTKNGDVLICGYQGYPYIDICYNSGEDMWEIANLNNDSTVTISLNQKGKYKEIQDTFSLCYSNVREDFISDEYFANFREIKGGKLKPQLLYRGASPVDNEYQRAGFVDRLLEKNQINFDVNLSDNQDNILQYQKEHESPYFNKLYQENKVILLNMGAGFQSKKLAKQLAAGLKAMLNNEGPYYIHCVEGKDRTGFIVAVLLGLVDATYDEIVADYMKTYDYYYGITKENNSQKFEAIKKVKIDDYLANIGNVQDLTELPSASFKQGAINYLRFGELNDNEINQIINLLTL